MTHVNNRCKQSQHFGVCRLFTMAYHRRKTGVVNFTLSLRTNRHAETMPIIDGFTLLLLFNCADSAAFALSHCDTEAEVGQ